MPLLALLAELPPPEADPDAVREAIDDILREPRYREPTEPLLDRILGWFFERLGDLVGSMFGGPGGTVLVFAILAAVIGGIVVLIVRGMRMPSLPSAPARRASTMVELSRTRDEWLAEAASLEAEGRWREGLRCRHRALVADLVAKGWIPERAGRTAREYVGDVRRRAPGAEPAMREATELFERAWYGAADTGAAEAARFAALDEAVRSAEAADRTPATTAGGAS